MKQITFLDTDLKTKVKEIKSFTPVDEGVSVKFPDGTQRFFYGRQMDSSGKNAPLFQLRDYFMGFINITEVN